MNALKSTLNSTAPASKDLNYPWKVLGIVMLGTLMGTLDQSIVNVSLPAIMADFAASLDDIEWVVTGYMLAFATLMPLTSWVREQIGGKALFITSLLVFTIGSALCGLAWNLPALVLARVLQALGGGAITPTGMAMISEEFPPEERARALGYWGMGVVVGPAFGPSLGGWLTSEFGWRSIFLINLPMGVIGISLASSILRADRPQRVSEKPFDLWGFIFLSLFLISFLLGLSKGEHEGWGSYYILTCALLSVVGFTGFLLVESILPYRIMDLGLFRYPVFSACIAVTVVRSLALFGGVFLLPLYLQQMRGLDEVSSGVLLLWGSLLTGLMMPLSTRLMQSFGAKTVTIAGLLAVACFMFMLRDINVNTSTKDIIFATLVRGFGIGLMFTPVTAVALNSVPTTSAGMASSILNLIQQVGGSIGITALATVFSHRTKFHMSIYGSELSSDTAIYRQSFQRLSEQAHLLGYSHLGSYQVAQQMIGKSVSTMAQAAGFGDAFLFGMLIVLAGIGAASMLPNKVKKLTQEEQLAAME